MTDAEARQRLEACNREALRKAHLRMFDPSVDWASKPDIPTLEPIALKVADVSDERLFPNIAGVKGASHG